MAKLSSMRTVAVIFGSALAAWFVSTFFIYPFLVPGGYSLNIQTVIGFANPVAVFIFLILWAGFASGYGGLSIAYSYKRRNGR